jgi:transposase
MNLKKEMAENHHRVLITEEIRKALREKRLGFGMSYTGAAEFIGVHWSTYRKWETGETTKYTREIERRVQCFLTEEKPSIVTLDDLEKSSRTMDKLIHRLRNTYRLCQRQPRLQERLAIRLEGLIDEVLSIYSQNP